MYKVPHSVRGHGSHVNAVAFSPDGKLLALASNDWTIKLWDYLAGRMVQELLGHTSPVNAVTFSPDGQLLASASSDHTVRLWSVRIGLASQESQKLDEHTDWVRTVAFSPDGKFLASTSDDGTIGLWKMSSEHKAHEVYKLDGFLHWFHAVAFSPDGKLLATASDDQTIRLWNMNTMKEVQVLNGMVGPVMAVAFAPDGQMLASASTDQGVRLWNLNTRQEVYVLDEFNSSSGSYAFTFSPNGKLLASASWNDTITLWDVDTRQKVRVLNGHTGPIKAIAFTPNGQLLASTSLDQTVKLWDMRVSQKLYILGIHTKRVRALALTANDELLASASDDKTIKLWNVSMKKEIRTFSGHTASVLAITFAPDGRLLASASVDRTVNLWNVDTGQLVRKLRGHTERVNSVTFFPHGQQIASAASDQTIILWDVTTGHMKQRLVGHYGDILSVAISSDGVSLASATALSKVRSDSATIKLWNVNKRQHVHILKGHFASITAVAFSPNNELLASTSDDRTIRLWNVRTGQQVRYFLKSSAHIAFSEDGQRLRTEEGSFELRKVTEDPFMASEPVKLRSVEDYLDDLSWDHEKLLRVHPLSHKSAVKRSRLIVAVGQESGEVVIVQLTRDKEIDTGTVSTIEKLYKHKFDVEWEGKRYLEEQFDGRGSIGSIPVLWQDTGYIKLGTCAEFKSYANADIVRTLVSLIDNLHWGFAASTKWTEQSLGDAFWFKAKGEYCPSMEKNFDSKPTIEISIQSNWNLAIEDSRKVLYHLALVLRPAWNKISWSHAESQVTSQNTRIRLSPLKHAQLDKCWLPIFSQKVIAQPYDFGTRNEHLTASSELELSLNDLIDLSGADLTVDFDGGICLMGVYSMLIPISVRKDENGDSLLWHLFVADYVEMRPSKARRKLWTEVSEWAQNHKRFLLPIDNVQALGNFDRHILGWTKSSIITLGTKSQPFELKRTGAAIQAYEEAGSTFNMGMSLGFGGSSMTGSVSKKYGRTEVARIQDRDRSILDWLAESLHEQILLYEPNRLQAWLVPKISVLHHLALERMHYVTSHEALEEVTFPYFEPLTSLSDPQGVYKLLAKELDLPFPHLPDRNYQLRDALHSILCVLDIFERSNLSKDKRRTLKGFEAYDAIHQTPFFRLRKADTSSHPLSLRSFGGWVNLLDDVPIILFYTGIEDPIMPLSTDERRACNRCGLMPRKRNYLAAKITSLYEMSKRYRDQARLTDCAWWEYQNAWDESNRRHICIERRLQTIIPAQPPSNCPPEELFDGSHNGAVIFDSGTGLTTALRELWGKRKFWL